MSTSETTIKDLKAYLINTFQAGQILGVKWGVNAIDMSNDDKKLGDIIT